jgi:hypothetical protein
MNYRGKNKGSYGRYGTNRRKGLGTQRERKKRSRLQPKSFEREKTIEIFQHPILRTKEKITPLPTGYKEENEKGSSFSSGTFPANPTVSVKTTNKRETYFKEEK